MKRVLEAVRANHLDVSAAEQQVRIEVAMLYRLMAHFGLVDLTDGFACARLPDTEEIVIGGYAVWPAFVRASELHKRPLAGDIPLEKKGGVDIDAQLFARTVLRARSEFGACIHAHSRYATIFSALQVELLPISQFALMFRGKVGYVDFVEYNATSDEQCEFIGRQVASGNDVLVLRNHGLLIGGSCAANVFHTLYRIEQACMIQVEAMKTGATFAQPPSSAIAEINKSYWNDPFVDNDGQREWNSYVRLLDRLDPSYRD